MAIPQKLHTPPGIKSGEASALLDAKGEGTSKGSGRKRSASDGYRSRAFSAGLVNSRGAYGAYQDDLEDDVTRQQGIDGKP